MPGPDDSPTSLRPLLVVFVLALALRLWFLFAFDPPLMYAHPYTYFTGALRIVEHPHPVDYVLRSDEWRTWDRHWTIAPLYFVFVAGLFKLLGAHLVALQVVQCVFDALVAALVAWMGRRLAGPIGIWAGVLYAVYWSALELPTQTLTENLHTILLVSGLVIVARVATSGSGVTTGLLVGGFVLGVSALTRSVSAAFIPLVALWQWQVGGLRVGWRRAAFVCVGGAAAILPWTARNFFIIGEHVPIETTAYENILWANHLGTSEEYAQALQHIAHLSTPAAKREAALHYAIEGVTQHPDRFVKKVEGNFWHILRPDGLDGLLRIQRSVEPWGHVKSILGDDLPMLLALPLALVFAFAGRPSPVRTAILLWCGYFLFMVIVVFHNEARYRASLAPFVAAAAVGGLAVLREGATRRRMWARVVLAGGLVLCVAVVRPYVVPAVNAWRAWIETHAAESLVRAGDTTAASAAIERAAEFNPRSAWPYMGLGQALARSGDFGGAVGAYRDAQERATSATIAPRLALPALLIAAGRETQALVAMRRAHDYSWSADPWLALEVAWAELPAPHTDEIEVGGNDYGAVRNFLQPRGDPRMGSDRTWRDVEREDGLIVPPGVHRWSRARAWLRLVPRTLASSYDVTLMLGVPAPGRLEAGASAVVRIAEREQQCVLATDVRACTLRGVAAPPAVEALIVELRAPTWNRVGEPAEQGVRVERLTVTPTR